MALSIIVKHVLEYLKKIVHININIYIFKEFVCGESDSISRTFLFYFIVMHCE